MAGNFDQLKALAELEAKPQGKGQKMIWVCAVPTAAW